MRETKYLERTKKEMARTIEIGNRLFGPGKQVCLIAKIGIHHKGEIELAQN